MKRALARHELLFASSPVALYFADESGRILDCNDAFAAVLGFSSRVEVLAGQGAVLPPTTEPGTIETSLPRRDGLVAWVLRSESRVVETVDGVERALIAGTIVDITARKATEMALADRAHETALVAAIGVALTSIGSLEESLGRCTEAMIQHLDAECARVWVMMPDGDATMFGRVQAETLPPQHDVLTLTACSARVDELRDDRLARELVYEVARLRTGRFTNALPSEQAGKERELCARLGLVAYAAMPLTMGDRVVGVIDVLAKQPLRRSAGKALGAAADAITLGIDRHRSEQALRESELKFHTLVEEAPDAIISFDPLGRYELFNPAAVRMSGLAASEVLGRTITQAALFAPASLTRIVEELAYVLEGRERPPFEVEIVRRDGGKLTMEASGRGVVREGITTGVQATLRDVTARKVEAEKRKELEEQLRQALKMEAVGRLAGGIAHDFNNLLAVILNYASIVIEELRDSDPTKQDVEEILKAATRAASLTKQLLIFSRREVIQPEVLDLNEVVADMERLLRRTIGEDVALVTSFSSSLRRVNADRGQVEQVIMNLALNARDAMPNGGRLTIETANVDVEGSRPAGLEAGRYVRLSVADTGHGMTDEIASRAFEPFFTTKPKGKGTGLGLSTVYGIVKQASGHIDIVTRPGVGTRFEIFLPPTDRPERSRSGISTQAMQALRKRKTTGNETVLVAEDEDGVRALTCRILARNGYTVLEARGPGDALLASEQYDGRIDLLLSDVVMPQMSGRELAERLLRIRSDMRVLYMSGYPGDVIAQHQIEEGTVDLIQKPFTEEALMAKVRDVLERPPANITTVG